VTDVGQPSPEALMQWSGRECPCDFSNRAPLRKVFEGIQTRQMDVSEKDRGALWGTILDLTGALELELTLGNRCAHHVNNSTASRRSPTPVLQVWT
jgi:hypothetical protein